MDKNVINHAVRSTPGEGQRLPVPMLLRLSSAQTSGALEVIEIVGPGAPTPHVHRDHEECFYITEGLFTFTLGQEVLEAPAGSLVYVSRGTPHAFTHSEGARALVFVIPAALEGFFRELGEGFAAGKSKAELRSALSGKYDSWPIE